MVLMSLEGAPIAGRGSSLVRRFVSEFPREVKSTVTAHDVSVTFDALHNWGKIGEYILTNLVENKFRS